MKEDSRYPNVQIHETALVAADSIGEGTRIWAFCNLLPGASIGKNCQICDRVFIETGARLGDHVTIKCGVSVWDGITLEDHVFVGPGVMFTNDPYPRSQRPLAEYPQSVIKRYASLGAGAIILPGIEVGRFALVGAGTLVSRKVLDFSLVVGNPMRQVGWVCVCGQRLDPNNDETLVCQARCGREYRRNGEGVDLVKGSEELIPPADDTKSLND